MDVMGVSFDYRIACRRHVEVCKVPLDYRYACIGFVKVRSVRLDCRKVLEASRGSESLF